MKRVIGVTMDRLTLLERRKDELLNELCNAEVDFMKARMRKNHLALLLEALEDECDMLRQSNLMLESKDEDTN